MEDIIEEIISDEQLAQACQSYEKARKSGKEEIVTRFQYAHALLRSKHIQDITHGIKLLEDLYQDGEISARRDYLYYIAIGHTRMRKYNLALDCVDHFLHDEPENHQAKQLKAYIEKKLTKDGLVGMAITGGAALVLGGLIGLGISLAKK